MVVLKNNIYNCYFKYLKSIPKNLRNIRYFNYQLYISKKYCKCKYCNNILIMKRNSYLEKFKLIPF